MESAQPTGPQSFTATRLTGTTFHDVCLGQAKFDDVNLGQASFHDVNLAGARFDDVNLSGVAITDANLAGMTINGVLVTDLLAAHARVQRRDE